MEQAHQSLIFYLFVHSYTQPISEVPNDQFVIQNHNKILLITHIESIDSLLTLHHIVTNIEQTDFIKILMLHFKSIE